MHTVAEQITGAFTLAQENQRAEAPYEEGSSYLVSADCAHEER